MTLRILNRGITKADRNNVCRDHAMRLSEASTMPMVCLVLSFYLVGTPLGVLAVEESRELTKPSHMTVSPVFQEWQFDQSTLNQVPEGFSLEESGTSNKRVAGS